MRETFAFQPAAPAQVQPGSSGQTRGAQIVGGESRSGMVAAGPQTDAGPVAAGLGQFVEQIMQPHVQRRQQEEFFKGFTKAQEGVAIGEISKSHGGFGKIFGPTSYEQGAAFYTARTKMTDWAQARYGEMDTLKQLPPEEAAKLLADKSRELMTGNPEADQLIQTGLIEQSGPLMNTIGKARYAWQQTEALKATSGAWRSGAGALQAASIAQASLSAPSDEEQSALRAQGQSFLAGMMQPHGMDDETYKKGLFDFMRQSMQEGNFHAVNLLQKAGIDSIFDDAERTKLEDAQHRFTSRAVEEFTTSDEGFMRMALSYEEARGHTALADGKAMTPMDAAKKLTAMNEYVKRMTGVSEDLFDFSDVKGEVRSFTDMVVSAHRRAEDRANQLADREAARQERREERAQDNADAAAAAGAAWGSGDVGGAIAGGVEERHFNRIATAQFRQGNYTGMARAFTTSGYTSGTVKNGIQGMVQGALEEQYGKNFAKAHGTWRAMLQQNAGMTSAYFGEYHEKMRAFDTLSRTIGPEAAYRSAFGDPSRYSAARLPPEQRKEASTAIASAVASKQPSSWNPFARQYSPQAVRVMQGLLTDRVALGLQNSDTAPGVLAPEALSAAMADGSLQTAGGEAWRAAPGTKPFRMQLGLQQDEADGVFRAQVDFRLKRAGLKAGIGSTLDINYVDMPNGGKALHVIGRDADNNSANILIPMQAFKDEQAQRMRNNRPLSSAEREKMRRENYFPR